MSGHSKWAKTHRQKSVTDAKKGAIFTKLANLITIAARESGGDPETNFKLRLAVDKAREANMPKDNIERAIAKGTGANKDGVNFEEIIYEVIGPAGAGFIIEAITDNKNRTVADLKSALNKNGGQLGSSGSVSWNFKRLGSLLIESSGLNEEQELELIDAGAEDIKKITETTEVEINTPVESLFQVANKAKEIGLNIKETSIIYQPKEEITITDAADRERIERLYGAIDDLDDITNVYTNASW
ncbi:MAG: YebC/PmpR family DNA-binding transcriptional regulator [Patescibacteria group bacterium]|jgi:YebC/PmpR family DNA-binding regulatory protein